MIIARAPLRLTLGGGGTDLPSYYSRHGGMVVSAGIDKYVFIALNSPKVGGTSEIKYALGGQVDMVTSVDDISHALLREACKLVGVDGRLEVTSMADVPSGTGLGSSGAFLVALLTALHTYKREAVPREQIAEEACEVEMARVGNPVGKQDQYIASLGGITRFDIAVDGRVHVSPLAMSPHQVDMLRSGLVMYYTGIRRDAFGILAAQQADTERERQEVIDSLHRTKEIGEAIATALCAGDFERFGDLMDEHWQNKKRRSADISDPTVDEWYDLARKHGALGGKLMGAGGGGFFVFYTPHDQKRRLRMAMSRIGLQEMPFGFDADGAKIVANL